MSTLYSVGSVSAILPVSLSLYIILLARMQDATTKSSDVGIVSAALALKADVAALKGFITSFEDVLRPAYAKKADQY